MSDPALDAAMMRRAISEATRGRTRPNPRVGAVVARGEEVIATGFHRRAGAPHAEVEALSAAGERARGATLYCTLEPCNHTGRTPPCSEAVIAAGVARLVVACADPAPHVSGSATRMRAAGVEVEVGLLAEEAWPLIADFTRHITTGLPYAVLKAAVTLDGRLATRTGDSQWITGVEARAEAHRMRDRADAILVGVGTVLMDDPTLNVRHVEGLDPIRVVLDTKLRTPPGSKVIRADEVSPTWILHGPGAPQAAREALRRAGAELFEVSLEGSRVSVSAALELLGARDVMHLLVEGGAKVHGALLSGGHYQRAAIFVAPRLLGDASATPLADGAEVERVLDGWRISPCRIRQLGDDALFEGELVRADEAAASTAG